MEIWEPYVARFSLESKYETLYIADAIAWFDDNMHIDYDVIVFGDVLEHMTKKDSRRCWLSALCMADFVYMSIPIVHCPQGAYDGNPYETHIVEDWDEYSVYDNFPFIDWSWQGDQIGIFGAEADPIELDVIDG